MLDKGGFLPLGFLKAGGIQTGDHKGMRYRLVKVKKEEESILTAWVWSEPFGFDAVADDEKETETFPLSEEGRSDAIDWIISMYEIHRERWDAAPSLLTAFRTK